VNGVDSSGDQADGPAVLLVEDDPLIASFVVRCLQALRFPVEWVTTGAEALSRIERGGVHVQILDLGLPDIDGLDVLRILRERGDAVPTIVITARADPAHRTTAIACGATEYLRKPFPLKELVAAVRACAG
jgi:DNA-binding response OmpR family regulator